MRIWIYPNEDMDIPFTEFTEFVTEFAELAAEFAAEFAELLACC